MIHEKRKHIHLPANVGEQVADAVAATVGSWRFIIIQSTLLAAWILLNSLAFFVWKWDPAPFILLNLMLSFQAAYTGPVVMMSQNRQSAKDRIRDDLEAQEVAGLFENHDLLLKINKQQLEILQQQQAILQALPRRTK